MGANSCLESQTLRNRSAPQPSASQTRAAGRAPASSSSSGGIVQSAFLNLLDRPSSRLPSKFAERKSTELTNTPIPFTLITSFGLGQLCGPGLGRSAEAAIVTRLVLISREG